MQSIAINLPEKAEARKTGWYLSGRLPPGRTLSLIPIDQEVFAIGRRPGLNLQLASARVSGRHAEILIIGQHLFVRDLGSTNGTFVNRRRVKQPTPIGDGDHIEIADIEFKVEFRDHGRRAVDFLVTAQSLLGIEFDEVLAPRLAESVAYCLREAMKTIPSSQDVGAKEKRGLGLRLIGCCSRGRQT